MFPATVKTDSGPTYEGRQLPRPDDEIVDQGAGFDLRTLISRRGVLGLVGVGVGAATLAACSSGSASDASAATSSAVSTSSTATGTSATVIDAVAATAEIPDETAGPYPGDGSNGPDVLESSGIVRSDIRSSIAGGATADGLPFTFVLSVTDMANGNVPFSGAAVYAWHCDAEGRYSMYSDGVEDETYLRGVQVVGDDGRVTFTSIVPGCYSGRWPHVHFEVYPDVDSISDSTNAIATSQMAIPETMAKAVYQLSTYDGSLDNLAKVTLATDNVFGDDSAAKQLPTVSGDTTSGYTAILAVGVDTSTTPTGGGAPAGGGSGRPA